MLALSQVIASRAGYGRQLAVRSARDLQEARAKRLAGPPDADGQLRTQRQNGWPPGAGSPAPRPFPQGTTAVTIAGMTDPVLPEEFRISDIERATGQERLQRAVRDGQLDLHEFDERCARVWAARTRGDLAAVIRDLPEPPPAPPPAPPAPRHRVFAETPGGTTMRVLATVWACALAVNLVVWVLVSLASGDFVYVWPIWLAPSGALLAVLYATGIGRPRPS